MLGRLKNKVRPCGRPVGGRGYTGTSTNEGTIEVQAMQFYTLLEPGLNVAQAVLGGERLRAEAMKKAPEEGQTDMEKLFRNMTKRGKQPPTRTVGPPTPAPESYPYHPGEFRDLNRFEILARRAVKVFSEAFHATTLTPVVNRVGRRQNLIRRSRENMRHLVRNLRKRFIAGSVGIQSIGTGDANAIRVKWSAWRRPPEAEPAVRDVRGRQPVFERESLINWCGASLRSLMAPKRMTLRAPGRARAAQLVQTLRSPAVKSSQPR